MGSSQRIVIFAYIVVGLIVAVTLSKLFTSLALLAGAPNPALLGTITLANVLGAAIGGGVFFYALKNEPVRKYSNEVFDELRKVTWPSRKETRTATIVVIVTTLVVSMILGLFDQVWGALTGLIYHRA